MAVREFEGTERFVVRRKLGSGGMGIVYEAFDRVRGTNVALKRLHRLDAQNIYRMKQEFRALADVAHPNLAQLHELVFEDGVWFFTMELLEGQDFLAYVREPGSEAAEEDTTLIKPLPKKAPAVVPVSPISFVTPLELLGAPESSWESAAGGEFSTLGERPPALIAELAQETKPRVSSSLKVKGLERTRDALRQLAEGMFALHEAGKLHRDIKPSNVMVTKNGRVVLLDFGLVTELYEEWLIKSTAEGLVCGTIAYMAPEQGAGQTLDPASDWYSVGVMLFEALTGRLPFEGKLFDILLAKQTKDAAKPSDFVSNVPEDLDRLAQDLLRRDPQLRPRGQEVLSRLGGGSEPISLTPSSSWSTSSSLSQVLIGREAELAALENTFAIAEKGRPAIAHVSGRSGMGKTALVKSFLDRLVETERAVVFPGRCYERELVPYKAMDSVIDALSRYLRKLPEMRVEKMVGQDARALSRIFPVLNRVEAIERARVRAKEIADPLELRRRAFAALGAVFRGIAEHDHTPIIFVDDAQWGDGDSAALLGEMTGGASSPPVLIVLAYRNDDRAPSPLVRALEYAKTSLHVAHIPIGPLSIEDSQRLARAILPADREARAKLIARECGGSPLFVHELAAFGGEEIQLDAALAARFRTLPEDAQRLLAVIASAARPIAVASANRAAGLSAENRAAIGVLRNARLVRMRALGHGDEVEVYHDRIAEAALKGRSTEWVRLIHVALLAELERSNEPDPEALVVHMRAAGELRRAGEHAVLAARRAEEALAFDRAASLLEIGVQLAHSTDTLEWELRRALGDALVKAARGAEAADAYLGAALAAPATEAIEIKRRAAEALLRSGYIGRGLAVIREVLSALDVAYPETHDSAFRMAAVQRLELLVRGLRFREKPAAEISAEDRMRMDALWSAATGLAMVDSVRAAYFHSRMMVLALRAGDPYRFARSLSIEACIVGGSEASRARGMRVLDLLGQHAEKLDHPHLHGLTALATGFMSFLRGEWSTAIEALERSLSIFEERCTAVGWETDTAQLLVVSCMGYRGEVLTVPHRVFDALREADARRNRYVSTILRVSPNVNIAFAGTHRVAEARAAIDMSMARWSSEDFHLQHYHAVASHALLDLYDGEYLRAFERVDRVWDRIGKTQLQRLALVRFETHYVRARVALAAASIGRDVDRLVELARSDAREISDTEMAFAKPIASLIRAQIAAVSGEAEIAEKELVSSIEALGRADMALHRAAAMIRLGQLRGGAGGAALIEEAETAMRARGVVDPERMTMAYAPVRWG